MVSRIGLENGILGGLTGKAGSHNIAFYQFFAGGFGEVAGFGNALAFLTKPMHTVDSFLESDRLHWFT